MNGLWLAFLLLLLQINGYCRCSQDVFENDPNNFWYNLWPDSELYQNPFCMVPPEQSDPADLRFNVHSFAVVHHKLYIFAATCLFEVPLEQDSSPPYEVHRALQFTELSSQLSNALYDTQHTTSRLFTTVAFELNPHQEVFLIGHTNFGTDYHDKYNQLRGTTTAQQSHTDVILRDLRDPFKQPDQFAYDFSAYLTDTNIDSGGSSSDVHIAYNRSRFISGQGYFFHVVQDRASQISIMRYDVKAQEDEHSLVQITPTEWYLYSQQTSNQWLLRSSESADSANRVTASSILGKNGYITSDRMYLSAVNHIEEYKLSEVSDSQMVITFNRTFPTTQLVNCRLSDDSRTCALYFALVCALLIGALLAGILLSKRTPSGTRFVSGPNLALKQVEDHLIYTSK